MFKEEIETWTQKHPEILQDNEVQGKIEEIKKELEEHTDSLRMMKDHGC